MMQTKLIVNSSVIKEISRTMGRAYSFSAIQQPAVGELRNITVGPTWDEAKPYSEIPGEKSVLRTIRNFLPGGKYHKKRLLEIYQLSNEEYGNIVKIKGVLGKPEMLFVYAPEDFEKVYRNEGPWPYRQHLEILRHFRKNVRPDIYGEIGGLFIEHESKWKDLRSKVNPVMIQPRVVKQYVTPVEEVAEEFITKMLQLRDSNNELPSNFGLELNKWALESIARIALDAKLGCFQDDDNTDSDGQRMIQCTHDMLYTTNKLEFRPSVWKYIRTPAYNKLMNALETLTNLSSKKIDEAIEKLRKDADDNHPEKEASVLEKLLKIDYKLAVVVATDMLMGGIDTTTYTTSFLLYFLARNQRVQDKLREEVLTILPEKNSKLTSESFNHIPYMRACMKEANRILPTASGNMRRTAVDLVLSGYQVPKGSFVAINHQVASTKGDQFPNPGEYIPERWLGGQSTPECPAAKSAHPFAFMPFGFGSRSCIGKRFAELEIETLITKLIRNHRIEWNYGDIKLADTLLIAPASPLRFKITEL